MSRAPLKLAPALLLTLVACGGGGGGGGASGGASGGDSSSASQTLSLASSDDAARELAMVMQLATQRLGALPGHGSSTATSTSSGAKAAGQSSCSGGGTVSSQAAAGTHDFRFFGNQTLAVSGEQQQYTQCVQPVAGSSTQTETLDGLVDSGSSASASDGSRYLYQLLGDGSDAYRSSVTVSSNGSTASFTAEYLGEVETLAQSNGDEDIRAVLQTRVLDNQNEQRDYDVGISGAPFIVALNDRVALSVSGHYAYQTPSCSGGSASVATPSALQFDTSSGVPVAGSLQLRSGSHQLQLQFQADGSATLQLDGSSLTPLSSTEVHSALWRNPC